MSYSDVEFKGVRTKTLPAGEKSVMHGLIGLDRDLAQVVRQLKAVKKRASELPDQTKNLLAIIDQALDALHKAEIEATRIAVPKKTPRKKGSRGKSASSRKRVSK